MINAINWFEIPVADLTRAIKFYEALIGGKLKREPFGAPGEEMAVFVTQSQEGISGALLQSPRAKPAAEGSMVYLNAAPSIDACLSRVEPAGGTIVVPKTALPPGMGFFAHIRDSEGNHVGLHSIS